MKSRSQDDKESIPLVGPSSTASIYSLTNSQPTSTAPKIYTFDRLRIDTCGGNNVLGSICCDCCCAPCACICAVKDYFCGTSEDQTASHKPR